MLGHGGTWSLAIPWTWAPGPIRHGILRHRNRGKCPCRIGSTRGVEVIDRLRSGERPALQATLLRDLCNTLTHGSLCALGGLTPMPVISALDHFPEDFSKPMAAAAVGS